MISLLEPTVGAVKVFKMNDCDWVAALSLEDALAFNHDIDTDAEPEELTEDEMHTTPFHLPTGEQCSFFDQLRMMIEEGAKFPCLFASTEF